MWMSCSIPTHRSWGPSNWTTQRPCSLASRGRSSAIATRARSISFDLIAVSTTPCRSRGRVSGGLRWPLSTPQSKRWIGHRAISNGETERRDQIGARAGARRDGLGRSNRGDCSPDQLIRRHLEHGVKKLVIPNRQASNGHSAGSMTTQNIMRPSLNDSMGFIVL